VSFLHPLLAIWAIALAPAAYVAQRAAAFSRVQMVVTYSDLDFLKKALQARAWPRVLRDGTRASAIALLLLAGAGPRWPVTVLAHGGAIVICIDTSGSMGTGDVKPTRWAAALNAVRVFAGEVPPSMQIGVVSFAGMARVLMLPAPDRDAMRRALTAVPLPNGQTALGDGLRSALDILPATGARAIVLLTDGESNRGEDPARIVRDLRAAHVVLYAIGVGQGKLAEQALQTYASATGGSYARVGRTQQFSAAFALIAAAATRRYQSRDVSEVPAFAGLLLLAAAWLASTWAGRLSHLGEPEPYEPLGHRDDAPQLRRAGRDAHPRRTDRIFTRMD